MLPAPIAARELERLRAERLAESARQLPLHAEDPSLLIPTGDDDRHPTRLQPEWSISF